jgi:hypothetical protein
MLSFCTSCLPTAAWCLGWLRAPREKISPPVIYSLLLPIAGAIGVFAGLYFFVRGFQLLSWKRHIEDTPITNIAGAAAGEVKVLGKAIGPYTIISPLAGVDCYYYRAIAWNGRDAQDQEKPEGRISETLFTPLFVQDETGSLMIDPRGALLEIPPEYNEHISGMSMAESARRFLHRRGLTDVGDTTVTEYAIKPGDPLLVLGSLSENPGLGTLADRFAGKHGTYLSREAADLQRYEQLDALGIRDPQLAQESASVAAGNQHPPLLLCKGSNNAPFVLSRQTPQRIIDDLARRSTLRIWGGPLLTLLSLALLLKYSGLF